MKDLPLGRSFLFKLTSYCHADPIAIGFVSASLKETKIIYIICKAIETLK